MVEKMNNAATASKGSSVPLTKRLGRDSSTVGGLVRAPGPRRWSGRSRRIVLLLIAIWVVNLFDLAFTLIAHDTGNFVEANPIARALLDNRPALLAFKLGAIVLATVIFLYLRRHWLTELGCWFLCGTYAALSFMWLFYYHSRGR